MALSKLHKYLITAISVSLLLISQTACTATQLPPYEATYTAKLRGIKIRGLRKFEEVEKDIYKLSWSAKALWMRLDEWSVFKVIDEKVIPISYHYTRKGLGSDRPIHIHFDWETMKVSGTKGKNEYSYDLEPGTLDKLSFQVQMQIDLLLNNQLKAAEYRIAKHNRLSTYEFSYRQNENIDTELGDQNTLVFERTKEKRQTRLWISPEQNYLPIKIENRDDGERNVLVIRSWDSESLYKNEDIIAKLDSDDATNADTTSDDDFD